MPYFPPDLIARVFDELSEDWTPVHLVMQFVARSYPDADPAELLRITHELLRRLVRVEAIGFHRCDDHAQPRNYEAVPSAEALNDLLDPEEWEEQERGRALLGVSLTDVGEQAWRQQGPPRV